VYEATEFIDAVPNGQVPTLLNRFAVYAALSRNESFGVAIVEASACGLPVVVTRVGGLPEVVVDGDTGLVVEREDVQAASDAILRLMKDPSLRKKMGEAGRRRVSAKYPWSESVAQMERTYAKVCKSHRACSGLHRC
jgi:glycosyltransferase involved in cell wall biosynthesis